MKDVLRQEHKFLLDQIEYFSLRHKLSGVLEPDPHNGATGYLIRSLYFDTIHDSDYFEKLDGVGTRRKMRLRIYDPNAKTAFLEMKQKQGSNQRKRSLEISRMDALRLTQGDYTPLLNYSSSFAYECYGIMTTRCYRPKTIVDYHREAYINKINSIRITFDQHVEATESHFNLFDPMLNLNPVLDRDMVILEVKYNGFLLSYIQDQLRTVDKNSLSVSKYILARQQGYQMK